MLIEKTKFGVRLHLSDSDHYKILHIIVVDGLITTRSYLNNVFAFHVMYI